jgi:hypothetical protein
MAPSYRFIGPLRDMHSYILNTLGATPLESFDLTRAIRAADITPTLLPSCAACSFAYSSRAYVYMSHSAAFMCLMCLRDMHFLCHVFMYPRDC